MATLKMTFRSQVLGRDVPVNVVLPFDRGHKGPYPTLYLLHGLQNNVDAWLVESRIARFACDRGLAVVMPQGENSFWVGVPPAEGPYGDFGTFVGTELVEATRAAFPLSTCREDTFIGGCSMGGYGALRNGIKYRDTFSKIMVYYAAVHFFEWEPADVLGRGSVRGEAHIFLDDPALRESDLNVRWLVGQAAEEAAAGGTPIPPVKIMVGTGDQLVGVNRAYAQMLGDAGVDVEYFEGPGGHDWQFIDEHLGEMLDWVVR